MAKIGTEILFMVPRVVSLHASGLLNKTKPMVSLD